MSSVVFSSSVAFPRFGASHLLLLDDLEFAPLTPALLEISHSSTSSANFMRLLGPPNTHLWQKERDSY